MIPFPGDPLQSAELAGLRYVEPGGPGITRHKYGKVFRYRNPDGSAVTADADLARIRSLAIPPAWTDVWICPSANGHVQATGRDAKGRKQYRYHADYRHVRDQTKFGRMLAFGAALPSIRARVEQDVQRAGLPRDKVLATVVSLLDSTGMRVGNDEYARRNDSYGLTTLRDSHVKISGSKVRFCFRGKSGRLHNIELTDARLARIVKKCRDIPGYELFQYLDESGAPCDVTSSDVNDYLRRIAGDDFTAKDFRTWHGTGAAVEIFERIGIAATRNEGAHNVVTVVKEVAARLGNRPATCKKYYVHPAVIEAYLAGSFFEIVRECEAKCGGSLKREEECIMRLIAQYVENMTPPKRPADNLSAALRESLRRRA